MSEPATARAMAFRVEDMEIEERVEALEQWGEDQREAGQAAGVTIGRREGWLNHRDCLEMEIHVHNSSAVWCSIAAGEDLAPEPGVEPDDEWTTNDDLNAHAVEQPSSLVEQAKWDLDGMGVTADSILRVVFIRHAEAIDALTADRKTVFDELNRLGIKVAALEPAVDNLETKTAHLPFPAAPEPGA